MYGPHATTLMCGGTNNQCNFGDKVKIKFERNDWIDHPEEENVDLSVLPLLATE